LKNAPLRERVTQAHRTAMIIMFALTASIAVYAALGLIILYTRDVAPRPVQARIPFFVAALFLALGSIAFRRTQLRWLRLEVVGGLRGPEGVIKHFFKTALVSAALAEAIGLLALVIVFFGGDTRDVLSLGIVALLIVLTSYPRRSAWEKAVEYFAANAPGASAG
jgi:F0F1-type ATP synthase membrane subunit c/vacuolar-type H+-ATPase subunit K